MLPLINGILSDSLQSLSAYFTGIMKKQHLLVQKSRATKVIKGLEHSSPDKRLREIRPRGMEESQGGYDQCVQTTEGRMQ